MKTLNEELNEVLNAKMSKKAKKEAIIKLGIREKEANFLLKMKGVVSSNVKFNATSLTFGVEIECYNVVRDIMISQARDRNINIISQGYNHTDSKTYYKLVSDCSIQGTNPVECVSPILKGNNGLDSLKSICETLNSIDAKVNKSTGLHVHFDASKLDDKHFIRIIKNYAKIESVIDSFMPISRRGRNNTFCKTLLVYNFSDVTTKRDIIELIGTRYTKVNAEAYLRHKTIEFRQHSGTTDFEKINSWINFLRKLIQFSYEKDIQECNTIEELPFLNNYEKQYFINRRTQLN